MPLLPIRHLRIRFNRGVSTEAWPPLIDGTYAIILTLLVIELPILVLDLLRDYNRNEMGVWALLGSIVRLLFGYFGVFLVVYDIWSKKRQLLDVLASTGRVSKFESAMLLLSLFMASLLPPFYYILNQLRQDYGVQVQKLQGAAIASIEKFEVHVFSLLFLVVGISIYLLISLAVHRRIRKIDSSLKRAPLVALRFDSLTRVGLGLLLPLFYLSIPAPWPGVIYGLSAFIRFEPDQKDV
jgi:uncharacterized membrane protein